MLENLKNLVVRCNYVSSIHAPIVCVSLIPLYEDQRHFFNLSFFNQVFEYRKIIFGQINA
jgi:hypothetical protein